MNRCYASRLPRALRGAVTLVVLIALSVSASAQNYEPVDDDAVALIRKQGLENSHVMDYLSWMTDVYGARLTGSPALDEASDWVIKQFKDLGMVNVHKDSWGPFGRGWTLEDMSATVRTKYGSFPLSAYPKAWSPGTKGEVSGQVVLVNAETPEEFERYRGKLAGKIVLTQGIREVEEPFEPIATRRDDSDLLNLANAAPAEPRQGGGRSGRSGFMERMQAQRAIQNAIFNEKPLAILDRGSKGDYGTIFVSGAAVPTPEDAGFRGGPRAWDVDAPKTVPQLTVGIEHYNRIVRLLEKNIPVTIDLNLSVAFDEKDPMEYNLIGEFKGGDQQVGDEIVMIGAHFDSWHSGTGATDNGAGSAVMMEAMRILKATYAELGRAPKRTIRIGLWTGEEQGLLGSRAYVTKTFAERGDNGAAPSDTKPAWEKFSGYYNMDNGTGKIRGVYMQGNAAVEPIFRAWLAPFADLGASTLTISNTGGTDHLSFDAVGLPGFQFIQEPIAYGTRTHHSNMDVYDHTISDDLKQAATIIASFVYHTAERAEPLPRKEMRAPSVAPAMGGAR